ncbi:unnamed protein product [Polarella glacialis]|uniref:Uncharacterized protein n=1 Tax=Polarella glacialis TaxID=89957 RepID=A0A813K1L6_POLGL|nr:unnamed protein product [Polarella glacialis]
MPPPRVRVCGETDLALNPPGKVCAPMGIPHLPGGLHRSQSQPNMAVTCPSGWASNTQKSKAAKGRGFQERQRESAVLSHSMAAGSWGDLSATLRTSSSQSSLPGRYRDKSATLYRALPVRPTTGDAADKYDVSKHGWYHPLGQQEQNCLADQHEVGSWAWTMHKARNHIGYGDDGRVDKADIQSTAVSGDAPAWLVGTRTLPGPFGTKKYPVRRAPYVKIDGKEVRIRAKTYAMGPGLSTIETTHDGPHPPEVVRAKRTPNPVREAQEFNKAKIHNFKHGGVQTLATNHITVFPRSSHITYETHDPRRSR